MTDDQELVEAILDGDMEARRSATAELAREGAVDAFLEILSRGSNDARWYAARGLVEVGVPAVDPLVRFLREETETDARRYAASALADLGEDALDSLLELLGDDDARVRGFASRALIRIGDPAVLPLRELAESGEDIRGRCAVLTLCMMGDPAVEEMLREET